MIWDPKKVNRIEVIDHSLIPTKGTASAYHGEGVRVSVHLQDDGRTMKIFVTHDGEPVVRPEGWLSERHDD
ncbi:hypothetical protein SEA_GODONK_44 [Gordonia phage GodonK]|uniref:Uncharacterized protein n=1 Tax=Gordonia phage GodonK TaxID=2562192 RepID=A0A4D6E1X2_9CAUD|nr:hypothetical protein HOV33_gp044 [Gordonia phage GodonK]QBZ72663.1 hypothetical protein SEA_GODONK_44 [Gordonia phage GodonK]